MKERKREKTTSGADKRGKGGATEEAVPFPHGFFVGKGRDSDVGPTAGDAATGVVERR